MRPLTAIDLKRLMDRLRPWEGRSLLEPFAGSAILSRAALQAGAARTLLLEKDVHQAARLKRQWSGDERVRVWRIDFRGGMRRLGGHQSFDLCFLDPPFTHNYLSVAIELVEKNKLLHEGGILAIKASPQEWRQLGESWRNMFTISKSDIILGAWQYLPASTWDQD